MPLFAHAVNEDDITPTYLGGQQGEGDISPQGGLTGYYQNRENLGRRFSRQVNPYMEQWAQQGQANQVSDRQSLQDLYGQLQKQAAGGTTPQQTQLMNSLASAAQNQATLANTAKGGPYGQAAARAAVTQNAGIQGAQGGQQMAMQQAADQIHATQQMQQVSAAQRAMDLQAQGMTAEDAMRKAQLEAQARQLNTQSGLGYAGLEGEAIRANQDAYLGALRRYYSKGATDDATASAAMDAGVQAGAAAIGAGLMFASDAQAKQAAYAAGQRDATTSQASIHFNESDYTPFANLTGYGQLFRHNATGAIVGKDPSTGQMTTLKNGPNAEHLDHPVQRTYASENSDLSPAEKRAKNKDMLARLGSIGPKSVPDDAPISREAIASLVQKPMGPPQMPSPTVQMPTSPNPLAQQAEQEKAGLMGALNAPSPLISDEAAKQAAFSQGLRAGNRSGYSLAGGKMTAPTKEELDVIGPKANDMLPPFRQALVKRSKDFYTLQPPDAPPSTPEQSAQLYAENRAKRGYDVSPVATSPAAARKASDQLLDKLTQSQSLYRYTAPKYDTNPSNPGQAHLGIMAQDLERTPTGASLVQTDPTGMRYINAPAGLSAAFAGLGRVNERLAALEDK
jgi:hypothetical protein